MASSSTATPVVLGISNGGSFILVQAEDFSGNYETIAIEHVVTQEEEVQVERNEVCQAVESIAPEPLPEVDISEIKQHNCLICDKEFTTSSNLNRHIKAIHGTEPVKAPNKNPICMCPLCDQDNPSKKAYIKHLQDEHDIHCHVENHLFKDWSSKCADLNVCHQNHLNVSFSSTAFLEWKKNIELKTKTDFSYSTSSRRNIQKGQPKNYTYYNCSRSGFFVSRKKDGERIRKMKATGTRKIGGCCPASIRVHTRVNSRFVEVDYCRTHVGHRLEEKHLVVPADIKAFIVSKLGESVPTSQILEEVKESFPRCQLVNRKTIANIAQTNGMKLTKATISKRGRVRKPKQQE
jgi:hypothetical protein